MVLGLTTVAGNVGIEQATRNALLTAEICNSDVPVFAGADKYRSIGRMTTRTGSTAKTASGIAAFQRQSANKGAKHASRLSFCVRVGRAWPHSGDARTAHQRRAGA